MKYLAHFVILCFAGMMCTSCQQHYTLTGCTGVRHEISAALDTATDSATEAIIKKYQVRVREIQAPVLGISAQYMEPGRPESLLSNLEADIVREAASYYAHEQADLSIINMGGIRNVLPQGDITVGHIFNIFPFENKLCLLTLKGNQLESLFEHLAQDGGQGISGARMTISEDGKLIAATVNGKPVDRNRAYRIATIDYLAEGNDNMTELREATDRIVFDTLTLRKVVMDYIVRQTKAGKQIESHLDGRTTIIKD